MRNTLRNKAIELNISYCNNLNFKTNLSTNFSPFDHDFLKNPELKFYMPPG